LPEIDLGHQAEAAQWLQAQDPARAPTPHAAPDTLLAVPVLVGHEKLDGVLVLLDPRGGPSGRGGGQDALHGVQSLAAQAGIVFENLALEQAQEDFMEALLKLLAGAIDAKSSYTGGHCARVPELARMLAEAASATRSGPLADFHFSTAQQWREFHIGTWLHDCGKVTTPEHVMDKATKLETVYNRIHEVRMRFEVLLRDAQIACLQEQQGGADAALAESRCAARVAELQADFAFVAECNIGGEVMAPERVQRLEQIAAQFWWRHFDDRLGLSHGERDHLTGFAPRPLPVREQLLADKPEHVVPRPPMDLQEHRYRFAMDVPEALYHYGELHNLRVQRGTLTPEDRFKINEHVIQTIVMLEQLPLPEDLKRIPEYAGTHHETLTGTGYPRRLDASQLSVPARIMAVADIFEALTAGDRPYKPAKTLSESLALLNRFKRDRHIDADVFDLFLTSGVYLEYARRFMKPEQMDAVDIAQYLG
jgi:HD-GYP domain-containing protein (c-di-GMP phosphodiesterase class II)